MSKTILSASFCLFVLISSCDALKCHQCSSLLDPDCADSMWIEPTTEGGVRIIKTEKFLKDCPDDGKKYTICRKIDQLIRGNDQVIRQCGFKEHKNPCYTTVLEEYNTQVCQCNTDGCNGAQSLNLSTGIAIVASALLAFLHY